MMSFLLFVCGDEISTTPVPSTTTQSIEELCNSHNSSCGECLDNPKCLWCYSKPPHCLVYPASSVIPSHSYCPLTDARWGTCTVNYEVLLICMGVIAGILLLSVSICICCCCCSRRGGRSFSRRERQEEAAENAEYEERRTRSAERRAERQVKYDEIRRKYGLGGDGANSSTPYTRFEGEADA